MKEHENARGLKKEFCKEFAKLQYKLVRTLAERERRRVRRTNTPRDPRL